VNCYAAEAGLGVLREYGMPCIEARIRELTETIVAEAKKEGYRLAVPEDPERRGALITLRAHDDNALVSRLESKGIVTSCRAGNLRISPHFYNDHDDIDTLMRELKRNRQLLV
jgi:selenocysteine lyase/cysteine desulfurase